MSTPDDQILLEWNSTYAVGVPEIDEEHQRLFHLAASLHQAMLEGKGKTVIGPLLDQLINYTLYHFSHEESLMSRCHYPDLAAHQAQHFGLRTRVQTLQARVSEGQLALTIEVMQFLNSWLRVHTTSSDRDFARYLHSQS